MQLVVKIGSFLRDTLRDSIRVDRLLPIADARKNMRRHVLRVCGVRGDFGVESRCVESLIGNRRIVVEVNQIVRDAGMLRLANKDGLKNRGSLELVGVGFVGR
jgi:hypothetical protein